MKAAHRSIATLCITSPCQAELPIVKGSMSYIWCPRWSLPILFLLLLLGKHMTLLWAAKRKNKNKVKEAKGCRCSVKVDRLKREVRAWVAVSFHGWQAAGQCLSPRHSRERVWHGAGGRSLEWKRKEAKLTVKMRVGPENCWLPSHPSASNAFCQLLVKLISRAEKVISVLMTWVCSGISRSNTSYAENLNPVEFFRW